MNWRRSSTMLHGVACLPAMLLAPANPAHAQSVEDFYRGKTVTILVGFTAGGGYDLYARLLGRHIGRHIPGNPPIVVQNMPGAGSLKATQFVYGVAPKDGTVLATVSRGMATEPLLNDAKFDATKLTWIGSITSETSVCATWQTSPVKTWDDMFKREFTLGGSATGADPDTFALILRNVFGAKVKLVTGYPGGNDINLAMERGEVDGRCGWSWSSLKSQKNWLRADQSAGAVRRGEECRPAGCAVGARARGERRAAAGSASADRGPVRRPAVLFAAGPPGRPQGCTARSVRRNHEGSAVPGGGRRSSISRSRRSRPRPSMRSWPTSTGRRRTWCARPWRRSRSSSSRPPQPARARRRPSFELF